MAPLLSLAFGLASVALFGLTAAALPDINNKTFEYIVVGSGPGGGPVAANLARAGHSVLLLEAGDDQTENVNVSQWVNFNAAGNDPATRWDFFVKHSDDAAREARYLHRTWRKNDGGFYVGIDPPSDAEPLGIYYPRAGTLGGCAMHNGCLTMVGLRMLRESRVANESYRTPTMWIGTISQRPLATNLGPLRTCANTSSSWKKHIIIVPQCMVTMVGSIRPCLILDIRDSRMQRS